jgi:hypothetical protein
MSCRLAKSSATSHAAAVMIFIRIWKSPGLSTKQRNVTSTPSAIRAAWAGLRINSAGSAVWQGMVRSPGVVSVVQIAEGLL